MVEEDNVPTYETSVLRAVAHEWVKVENFATIMRVVFKFCMKMNVENKLDKVVNILKEKGFVVYRKGGKEPGVFYAKEGDSRIGFVYPNNGYIYDRIKMWSFQGYINHIRNRVFVLNVCQRRIYYRECD